MAELRKIMVTQDIPGEVVSVVLKRGSFGWFHEWMSNEDYGVFALVEIADNGYMLRVPINQLRFVSNPRGREYNET